MAVTKGQGNPKWTRDETILALELYLSSKDQVPSANDPRVQSLSELLRSFSFHDEFAKNETFRNPDGVAFKLQNLKAVATGKGLNNTSKTDQAVWNELGNDPYLVKKLAADIKRGLSVMAEEPREYRNNVNHDEGSVIYRIHAKRERSSSLRKKFINKCRRTGELTCALCGSYATHIPPNYRDSVFEVHHIHPLNNTGKTKNSLKDLVLLCASCHRVIHKLIREQTEPTSIEEARSHLGLNA
ncbi:HNH endonuclease [Vibrio alginolyticus]|jgi:5-methylcytosine-specific restriction protein A